MTSFSKGHGNETDYTTLRMNFLNISVTDDGWNEDPTGQASYNEVTEPVTGTKPAPTQITTDMITDHDATGRMNCNVPSLYPPPLTLIRCLRFASLPARTPFTHFHRDTDRITVTMVFLKGHLLWNVIVHCFMEH